MFQRTSIKPFLPRRFDFERLEDRCVLSVGTPLTGPISAAYVPFEVNKIASGATLPTINDGRLAYHSYTGYGIDGELHVWDFALASFYTRAEQTVNARVRYAMNPQFSGDGRYLVLMGVDRQLPKSWPNLDVFAYDFQTDTVTNLSEASIMAGFFTQDWIDEDPSFSPTTLTVAFKRRNSGTGQSDLWAMHLNVANLSPASITQLTNTPNVEESGPKYSPDGQTIVCWVGGSTSASIGTLPAIGGAVATLADRVGIQDYYPSYWDSSRILYTSWDNASNRDDDIRIRDLVAGTDVFAAGPFHSAGEDSDAFRISSTLVGYSSTTNSLDGKWRLMYGDPVTGMAQVLPFHTTNKHDLGGSYTSLRVGYAVELPGDYNRNSTVDAADFVLWRHTLGRVVVNYVGADGDGSGSVDLNDYSLWRSAFGDSLSLAVSASRTSAHQTARAAADAAVSASVSHVASWQTTGVLADLTTNKMMVTETLRNLIVALSTKCDDEETARAAAFSVLPFCHTEFLPIAFDRAGEETDPLENFPRKIANCRHAVDRDISCR